MDQFNGINWPVEMYDHDNNNNQQDGEENHDFAIHFHKFLFTFSTQLLLLHPVTMSRRKSKFLKM